MGRILGIDYGRVRIGVSLSDETHFLASSLCCLKNNKDFFPNLRNAVQSHLIDAVVLGLPLSMNGEDTSMTIEVRQFSDQLKKEFVFPVILWDERMTTAQVERLLRDGGVKRKKRSQLTDVLAASLILQSYLDYTSQY